MQLRQSGRGSPAEVGDSLYCTGAGTGRQLKARTSASARASPVMAGCRFLRRHIPKIRELTSIEGQHHFDSADYIVCVSAYRRRVRGLRPALVPNRGRPALIPDASAPGPAHPLAQRRVWAVGGRRSCCSLSPYHGVLAVAGCACSHASGRGRLRPCDGLRCAVLATVPGTSARQPEHDHVATVHSFLRFPVDAA